MGSLVHMPMVNVNDESALLVRWLVEDGVAVRKNDPICIIETTKSAVDIFAEADGFLRPLVEAGGSYAVGAPIAFLAGTADAPLPDLSAKPAAPEPARVEGPTWTKKAEILAKRLGHDIVAIAAAHPGTVIGEELVQNYKAAGAKGAGAKTIQAWAAPASVAPVQALHEPIARGWPKAERVLILGGGGGGALVLDILAGVIHQQAVGILDNNPAMAGTTLMNVPVLGGFELAEPLWKAGKFDALISTVVKDIGERASIFDHFSSVGIPFTNIVSATTIVGQDVKLGTGNLIVHGGYLATSVELGNNNFLAAGTFIEHHSQVGSHCTFGPRTSLSGRVKVADRVKFGTHVAVEPFVEIGTESVIASGVVLTSHIPPRSLVKSAASPVIRHVG
ncbi:NeuD_NnaD, sugar O-acyltransferase, sialic acid O-acetyltransferase NeuD family [Rhabdaerophilaceae bacterium]